MSRIEEFVLKTLAIVLVPVVAGLSFYVQVLWKQKEDSSNVNNSFVAPYDLWPMMDYVKEATTVISCGPDKGSGFVFKLLESPAADHATWKFDVPNENYSTVLTNYHVIQNCIERKSTLSVELANEQMIRGNILGIDQDNDVAVIGIARDVDGLLAVNWNLDSGYWVMAAGSPLDLGSTVTFGHIINIDNERIYTSASLNRGNSGGPLVDNAGYVMGINTGYRAVAQNINWAISLNVLCQSLANCMNPNYRLIYPTEWE